jgi:hypothetical protein
MKIRVTLLIIYFTISGISGNLRTTALYAQVMSFSADTVTREACDSAFYLVGTISIYNLTDELIPLKWELIRNSIPVVGYHFLIVDGTQYLSFAQEGFAGLDQHDSIDVYFQYYIGDMSPGDSAIYQILIYSTADSANTDQLLTAILYCPLSTSLSKTMKKEDAAVIYPNPFRSSTTIQLSEEMDHAQLFLYNASGEVVRIIHVDGRIVVIERDNLPSGMYALRILDKGLLKASARLIVID